MVTEKGRWRWNSLIGKIVPVFLLVYLALAYQLVVVDYLYKRHFIIQGRRTSATLLALLIHCFFLPALWTYFRIYLARPVQWSEKKKETWKDAFKGACLYRPPLEPPEEIRNKRILFECDAQGDPIRCHRDQCNGRWKPARSRHCGDCRECRVALDHHCPWFDADVSAPQTMRAFLVFLALIPPLLVVAFSPLLGISYQSFSFIWAHASQSKHVHSIWWSRKKSWFGGPMYRWMIGFWLGSRECCRNVNDYFESPNLYIPVMLTLAIALILISSFLFFSTIIQLCRGDLTIDEKIRKTLMRRDSDSSRERAQRYFWVPAIDGQEAGSVVTCDALVQPYDHGNWRDNLRVALAIHPYTIEQLQLQWPLSPLMQSRLVSQAKRQAIKNQ